MIHGSTIIAQRQARRLYGGCPPCLLYHVNNLKSMGENEMAQSWQLMLFRKFLNDLEHRLSTVLLVLEKPHDQFPISFNYITLNGIVREIRSHSV